jgi:asparagine synthase (glutamine-hydrolysing)
MFRYVSLVHNPADHGQSETIETIIRRLQEIAPSYLSVYDSAGLRILCAEAGTPGLAVHALANNCGVLLGSVFKRHSDINGDSADSPAVFDSSATREVIASAGRSLITGYWGDYVAFLADDASSTKRVIKDPTGNVPCFVTAWRDVTVVFSCLSDLIELKLMRFSVNWAYVAQRVGSGGFDLRVSPLNEVSQVHRGQCLEIQTDQSARQARKMYWNPMVFADPVHAIDDFVSAMRALRASVRSATHSMAAAHNGILMRLSGGLDSSIVSGCLRDVPARPRVTSYTYFVPDARSDERRWARLAADHAGSDHLERELNPANTRLEFLSQLRPTVTPVWAYAYALRDDMEHRIGQSHPHSAVFCGDGGDSGFGGECISQAVEDFLRLRGLSGGIVKLASQVALRTNRLVWGVLARSLRRSWFGSSMTDYRAKLLIGAALVSAGIRGAALRSSFYPHPWFESCEHVPWHVIGRLGNLTGTPELYNPFLAPGAFAPYVAAPLYSQPVVELILRIPIYIHFYQGHERGLARAAFQKEVPPAILRRQWKDRAPGAFEDLVRRNRVFLYETLLGGVLCKERILDSAAIRDALSEDFSTRQFQAAELMNYLHLENWLRHFSDGSAQGLDAWPNMPCSERQPPSVIHLE